ncbi:MAG: hypothetical protein HWE27_11815 [Gammaproteobacteria bacterium]|nr:hypothetical protein [Gammaproteobacteria bacterium]
MKTITLSETELSLLSQWQPLFDLFSDRGYQSEEDICIKELDPLLQRLNANKWLEVLILEKGVLGSFYSIFLSTDKKTSGQINGIQISLSTLAPFAVIGLSRIHLSNESIAYSLLDYNELSNPQNMNCKISKIVKECLRSTCYKLVEPYQVNSKLPGGLKPIDYCKAKKPWDKLFHILFQSTD